LAVRHLDQGELREAITPLQLYLKYHPAAADVRLQLAECLFRTNQPQAARLHYELLWPQAINRPATREQVQLQTRLMQCAAADGDEAGEPYHRALGLWWLVASWDADPARRDEILAEQTLAEALDALREAENVTGPQITTQSLRRQILQRLGLPQPDLNRDR
jgi:tetratricopeptide (TPR) repeat protein